MTPGQPTDVSPTMPPLIVVIHALPEVRLMPGPKAAAVTVPLTVMSPVEVFEIPNAVADAVTLPVIVQVDVEVMLMPSPVELPASTLPV